MRYRHVWVRLGLWTHQILLRTPHNVLYRGYQLSVQYWVQYKIQNSIQNFGVKNDRIKNFKLQTPDQERMLKFRMFRKTRLFQIISVQRHVRRGWKNTLTVTTIDPPPLLHPTEIPRLYNQVRSKTSTLLNHIVDNALMISYRPANYFAERYLGEDYFRIY